LGSEQNTLVALFAQLHWENENKLDAEFSDTNGLRLSSPGRNSNSKCWILPGFFGAILVF
jgi:hypothetical protein